MSDGDVSLRTRLIPSATLACIGDLILQDARSGHARRGIEIESSGSGIGNRDRGRGGEGRQGGISLAGIHRDVVQRDAGGRVRGSGSVKRQWIGGPVGRVRVSNPGQQPRKSADLHVRLNGKGLGLCHRRVVNRIHRDREGLIGRGIVNARVGRSAIVVQMKGNGGSAVGISRGCIG